MIVDSLFADFLLAADGAASPGGLPAAVLPFVVIAMLFYFLVLRPQRREQSSRQKMLEALKKNDRVLTSGGIYGIVTNVRREADEVTVKVDEGTNTKLRLTLSSITRVVTDDPSASESEK